jgi:hypothetical protein
VAGLEPRALAQACDRAQAGVAAVAVSVRLKEQLDEKLQELFV